MNTSLTEKDIVCREFQMGKFDIKKIVPAVTMQMNVNIDKLLIQRDKLNKSSAYHITIYSYLAKIIADVIVNYPLLYSLFYKGKIIGSKNLILNVPVSVDNHVEYVVIRNPENKTVEDIAGEIQRGVQDISDGKNMLMQSLIEMGKMNKLQKTLYKLKNYKNPVYFLEKYYGYFPLTNFGTFNVNSGTTVISEPIVAAMSVGKAEKKIVIIDGNMTELKSISLVLSFDHRVMDGAYAGNFLNDLKLHIEKLM
jgi:pyruvate dehydrogenase E2 component (dihydrolipoamide acetyltransferase)